MIGRRADLQIMRVLPSVIGNAWVLCNYYTRIAHIAACFGCLGLLTSEVAWQRGNIKAAFTARAVSICRTWVTLPALQQAVPLTICACSGAIRG